MAIDFTLSNEQRELQRERARLRRERRSRPVVREADAEPDPLKAFQMTKPAYVAGLQARASRSACCPRSTAAAACRNVDLDHRGRGDLRGRSGLRLHGARQRARPDARLVLRHRGAEGALPAAPRRRTPTRRVHRRLRGQRAGRLPGRHGELRRAAAGGRCGIGVTATLDGDDYVLNGRKYWPCNVAGWDGAGRQR